MIKLFKGVILLLLISCAKNDPVLNEIHTNNLPSVLEIIKERSDLDSLSRQLSKFPDLISVLSDTNAELTFFAPNNQAFNDLQNIPGFFDYMDEIHPVIINGLIRYHIVPGKEVSSADLGPDLTTLFKDPIHGHQIIRINNDGTLFSGSEYDSTSVVIGDIMVSNGVIHIIDDVMSPPSYKLGSLYSNILLSAEFSLFASIASLADSFVPPGELPIAYILSFVTAGYFTLFAPPNAILQNIDLSIFTSVTARALFLNHIIPGLYLSSSFNNGQTANTLGGRTLAISVSDGAVAVGLDSATIPVISQDLTNNISNGVIHVIGGVIQ